MFNSNTNADSGCGSNMFTTGGGSREAQAPKILSCSCWATWQAQRRTADHGAGLGERGGAPSTPTGRPALLPGGAVPASCSARILHHQLLELVLGGAHQLIHLLPALPHLRHEGAAERAGMGMGREGGLCSSVACGCLRMGREGG